MVWWFVSDKQPPTDQAPSDLQANAPGVSTPTPGHVQGRAADGAGRHLALTVIDADGDALTSGGLVTACGPPFEGRAPQGASSGLGAQAPVSIGEGGTAVVSACVGAATCVRLRHPTLRAKEAWVFEEAGAYEVEVEAAPVVYGEVLDSDGAPLAGVRVSAARVDDSDPLALPPFRSMYAITDEAGGFTFIRITHDPCDLCAEAVGSCDEETARALPVWADVNLLVSGGSHGFTSMQVASDESDQVTLQLEAPAGVVTGTVLGRDGSQYARARVLARADDRPDERRSVPVGEDGEFILEGLGEGSYAITVVQDGRRIGASSSAVAGDTMTIVTDEVAAGTNVRVRVLLRGGPAEGLRVFGASFRGRETDEEGEVRAGGVVEGTYPVRIAKGRETLARRELVVRSDTSTYVIELD